MILRFKLLTTLFFTLVAFNIAFAQQNLTLYNMSYIQQASYANVGTSPLSNVNVAIAPFASTYLNLSNSGFKVADLLRKDGTTGGLNVDANNFLSKLQNNNYLNMNMQLDLVSFGFRVKQKNYFGFNVTQKVDVRFRYPKDFFDLLLNGNGSPSLMGRDVNFNFGLDAVNYREWGLYYNREIIENKLSVGGRVKYLAGMENINTKISNITLNTNTNDYTLTAKSDILINSSGLDTAKSLKSKALVKNLGFNPGRKNNGVAIDFGGKYKLNDKFSFTANVVDLGFIKWQENTTNIVSKNPGASVSFPGFDLRKVINDSSALSKSMQQLADTAKKSFDVTETHKTYKTMLTTQIYLGGNYHINEKNNAGVLLYGRFYDKKMHPALSLNYNNQVGRWLTTSVSYSILNRSYNNVGFGLALTVGPFQAYIVSDNILSVLVFDKYKSQTTDSSGVVTNHAFYFPAYTKNVNVRFGINLVFGRPSIDKDKDGVPDKKDECPDVFGLLVYKGCPDRDGDKIIDKTDSCPDVAGLPQFGGCPDTDNDGIVDSKDDCPTIAGPAYTKGCFDADNDSIKDADDKCPNEAGLRQYAGCPDKDGDGVIDSEDICPDKAGPVENQGCPDTDKDGVFDHMDLCPDKAGPKENNGCPQTKLHLLDKDGNIVATAVKGADGSFTFENLPADNVALFKLEGEDVPLNDLVVVFKGSNKKAIKGADGLYHFEVLDSDKDKLGKLAEEDTQVKAIVLKKEEEEIIKKAFNNLEFATAKDVIKPESFSSLDELAKLLVKKPEWRIQISGHTDNVGDPKKNMLLSKKRAMSVEHYLESKGVKPDHVIAKWYGSTKPIADNKTPEGRDHNRRVEMLIIE